MEEQKEQKEVEKLDLDGKIQKIKKEVSIMKKDSEGHGFKYVDEEKLLLKVNEMMIDLGLKLTPSIVPGTTKHEVVSYTNAKGQAKVDILVESEMIFTWKDIETKEKEEVSWLLEGQQAEASQAFGSGLTYANRYFLLKYFNIATTEDDPDAIKKRQEEEENKKKVSKKQKEMTKLFERAIQIFQKPSEIYKQLGTTKEEFLKDYNDNEKIDNLKEQLELLIGDEK